LALPTAVITGLRAVLMRSQLLVMKSVGLSLFLSAFVPTGKKFTEGMLH